MADRKVTHEKAQAFFEDIWKQVDPWDLERSEFEQSKYDREILILDGRSYRRALEIGCGIGSFTRRLAAISGSVLALDISPTAISRACEIAQTNLPSAEFRAQNIIDFDLRSEGPWDLMVMNETIYYLGWLYSFFDVAWLASELFAATREGGDLLMANTNGGVEDYLLRPWIIQTYHDLFINVGYELKSEEIYQGTKDDVHIDVLISLFSKARKESSNF